MRTHTYIDLKHGVPHSVDYRCSDGHLIHECFETIFFDEI